MTPPRRIPPLPLTAVLLALAALAMAATGCGRGPESTASGPVAEATAELRTPPSTGVGTTTTTRWPPGGTAGTRGTGRTTTTKPTSATVQVELRERYGLTLDAKQASCLGDKLAAKPDLLRGLDPTAPLPAKDAGAIIDLYVRCLGNQRAAAHALVETLVAFEQVGEPQASCLEDVLAKAPRKDLPLLVSGDEGAGRRYRSKLEGCASQSST